MTSIQNNREFPKVVVVKLGDKEFRIQNLQEAADFVRDYGTTWPGWNEARRLIEIADHDPVFLKVLMPALRLAPSTDPRYQNWGRPLGEP